MESGVQFQNPVGHFFGQTSTGQPTDSVTTEHSILQSLTLTVTSALAAVFVLRVIKKEENSLWRVVGFSVLAGSAFGALSGISGIIAHFVPEKK